MASTVFYQTLSSASQSLLPRTLLSLRKPIIHGHISRCLSTKLNFASCAMRSAGIQGNGYGSPMKHLPLHSAVAAPSKSLDVENNMKEKRGVELVPRKITSSDFEMILEQSLSRLTLSSLEARLNVDLMLPSVKFPNSRKVILDPSPFASVMPLTPFHDPASNLWITEIQLPLAGNATKKHASNILHKRRRKMNRHQYLKWKKRNKFKIRIQKQRSRKKKRLRWEQHLAKFRFTGLKPGEGEEYLAKKRESMAIYLRYLGIKTDEEEAAEKRKSQQAPKVGKVVPEPMLPEGAKIGSNN